MFILVNKDFIHSFKVRGQPPQKIFEDFLFQTTIDMHIQNPHKTVGGPLLAALAAAMCSAATKLRKLAFMRLS